ncbi:hypothetical protein glysoja_029865, partial [Glycine soja]
FSGKNSTLWPWRPGLESQQPHNTFYILRVKTWNGNGDMIDDETLGAIANFLGIFIFALVIAYHLVTADPKYEAS